MNANSIYTDAIEVFGKRAQFIKAAEECSELAAAILRYDLLPNEETADKVFEEMADVEIMLSQLTIMLGSHPLWQWKIAKLDRLEKRIFDAKELKPVMENPPEFEGADSWDKERYQK